MGSFDSAYLDTPPWDIGRPQRAIVELAEAGAFEGSVIDVGCGTGENALYLAGLGHETWGVDSSPRAIDTAVHKAGERDIQITFVVADALRLDLGRTFDRALDTGLFHVFDDADRPRYARSLAGLIAVGGRAFILCFSEHQPGTWGPRRVTQDEIRAALDDDAGWRVDSIRPARFEITIDEEGAAAWLAELTRIPRNAAG